MSLRLIRAQNVDIPQLVNVYFTTFESPLSLKLMPDQPGVRNWYSKGLESDMKKPYTHIYKVVEGETPYNDIVAFAKWTTPHPPEAENQWTDFPTEGDPALFEQVIREATEKKKSLLGDEQHWCNSPHPSTKPTALTRLIDIGVVATLPQYQRRGAASLLMSEFCKQVDEDSRHMAYVESSPLGVSLYRRFGFEAKGSFTTLVEGEPYVDLCMVREAKVSVHSPHNSYRTR